MRFNITFNLTGKQRMLPIDYQYYISAWIYKVIGKADPEFTEFLHDKGYTVRNKQFKLFCYSPLKLGKTVLWKEKSLFEVTTEKIFLSVSFQLPDSAERFIIGLFNNQKIFLGDRFNGLDLEVSQIERLADPTDSETRIYRAISPVVASIKTDENNYALYLEPAVDRYAEILKNNLLNKYNAIPGNEPFTDIERFEFKVLNTPKSKLVTIKPFTPEQSKVRGYVYEFCLTCPMKIHELIYASGIGEKNSVGFGWVEDYEK